MPLLETRASASARGYGLFGATSTGNFFLIQQLSPSAVSTITFNSIPATYKSLQVRFNLVTTAGYNFDIQFNGDTGTNYASHYLIGTGSAVSPFGTASATMLKVITNTAGTYPTVGIVDVLDYANANKNKTIKAISGQNNNTVNGEVGVYSGVWLSTSAITSLTFVTTSTFTGTISLYGVS